MDKEAFIRDLVLVRFAAGKGGEEFVEWVVQRLLLEDTDVLVQEHIAELKQELQERLDAVAAEAAAKEAALQDELDSLNKVVIAAGVDVPVEAVKQ